MLRGDVGRVQWQRQVNLERQHVGPDHRQREQQKRAVAQHRSPVLHHRTGGHCAVAFAAGQGEQLGDRQHREHRRRTRGGQPEVDRHEGQADQRPSQDAGLIEDVEQGERLHPSLAGVGGQVGPDRGVEQRPGETRCCGGDQHHRHRMGEHQQSESRRAQQATRDNQRLVAEPVGQGTADDEHALLGEVAHAENQADRPRRQSQRTGQIPGEVGHQHVEPEVDPELVDHQQPARPAEAAELSDHAHQRITLAGRTTRAHRVQEWTTAAVGSGIVSGSPGGSPPRSWSRQ